MIHREAYKDPENDDRHTLDVDPDDEVHYAANVIQWCLDSSTTVASFEPIPFGGVTVLERGAPQGPLNGLLPTKLKVLFTAPEPYLTHRVTTADGQFFNKTVWFKKVKN